MIRILILRVNVGVPEGMGVLDPEIEMQSYDVTVRLQKDYVVFLCLESTVNRF